MREEEFLESCLMQEKSFKYEIRASVLLPSRERDRPDHRLNMELDLQSFFGLCTAVLIG
jgi:hypothetical protein